MTSCTLGNGMRIATEDFELVLPPVGLPFGHLSPACRGRVIAVSGRSLSDGVLLYWYVEADTIEAVLEGSEALVVRMGARQ